jgi:ABC-type multidrug transport system fused ATPase/permease subunit
VLDATAAAGTYALTNYFDLGTSVLLLWYGGQLVLDNQDLSPGQLIKFQVRVMIVFGDVVLSIEILSNDCVFLCNSIISCITPNSLSLSMCFVCVTSLYSRQLFWNLVNSSYNAIASLINQFTRASAAAQRVFSLMDSVRVSRVRVT